MSQLDGNKEDLETANQEVPGPCLQSCLQNAEAVESSALKKEGKEKKEIDSHDRGIGSVRSSWARPADGKSSRS